MAWSGVSMAATLAFIEGTMKAPDYEEVLRKHLLPLVPTLPAGWTFQQDGARPHTAASTAAWLASKGTPPAISWPAHSPDLAPIVNIWGVMV